jgi:mannose-6-phosphate isomerase-like protein (cupin superfamily)
MEYIKKILNSMEKFVYENLEELLNERFVDDPEVDGSYEENFPDAEEEEEVEETEFTPEQKEAIEEFVMTYEGDFEDEDIHDLADDLGLEHGEVEEYIYNLAREGGQEDEDETPEGENSEKIGFHTNIEEDTVENTDFRRVLYTGENLQLVLMSLKPGEEIGEEVHEKIDQFFRFEAGTGKAIVNGEEYDVEDGDSVIIPAGSNHNIINTGEEDLKLYTIYAPPHHKDGIVFSTKEEAEESKEEFDGETTE